jgi:hypothetical protein
MPPGPQSRGEMKEGCFFRESPPGQKFSHSIKKLSLPLGQSAVRYSRAVCFTHIPFSITDCIADNLPKHITEKAF